MTMVNSGLKQLNWYYFPGGLIAITKGSHAGEPDPPDMEQLKKIGERLEQQGKCRFLKRVTDSVYFNKNPLYVYFYSPLAWLSMTY